jgi:hypothetical protein
MVDRGWMDKNLKGPPSSPSEHVVAAAVLRVHPIGQLAYSANIICHLRTKNRYYRRRDSAARLSFFSFPMGRVEHTHARPDMGSG